MFLLDPLTSLFLSPVSWNPVVPDVYILSGSEIIAEEITNATSKPREASFTHFLL